MKKREIEFPEYDERGQLFTIGKDWSVLTRTSLMGRYTAYWLSASLGVQLKAMAKVITRT